MDPRLLDAARSGDVDLLKKIAEEDADLLRGVTPFRNTALHIAVTFKQQEFVEEICARKPALLGERNRNCETPLHAAAILGSHRAVVFFLGLVAALDVGWVDMKGLPRAADRYGNTALHAALLNGHAEVAQEMVSADPGLASYMNEQRESPLYLAAMRGFLAIVQSAFCNAISATIEGIAAEPRCTQLLSEGTEVARISLRRSRTLF
ncbi:putative ankyrin repeat-containing protein [Cocos nucifera]|nr:putative ankyrin repeat-containing protein [Cocos nucifera]